MLSIVKTIALHGLDGKLLRVEVDVSRWTPKLGNSRASRHKCKRIKRTNKSCNKKHRA